MTGGGTGFDPHPAASSAIMATPAAARSSFLMRIGRIARRRGGIEMITL
jgi:superfamily II DNA or RNA helicase